VFYILVADVGTTCADAEQLGGSVVSKHIAPGPGARPSRICAIPRATCSVSSLPPET